MTAITTPAKLCTPITVDNLDVFCSTTNLPATAVNDLGESVVISTESFEDRYCYRLDTYQHNGWVRTNYYYRTGDTEELYSR